MRFETSVASQLLGKDILTKDAWGVIFSRASQSKVIDILNGSRDSGVQVRPFASNGAVAQLFTFKYLDGYYRVISARSGRALSVEVDDVVPGGSIVQRSVASSDLQLFAVRLNGDGTFSLLNKATGFALTMDGSFLTVQRDSGSASQRFRYTQSDNLLAGGHIYH